MTDITREPWNDPAKTGIAAFPSRMNGQSVQAVLLVDKAGEPVDPADGEATMGATSVVSSVAAAVVSTLLKVANVTRIELLIENDSPSEDLYIKYGTAASLTDFSKKLEPGDAISIDTYNGIVHGIWSAAIGDARITEVTP